MRLEFKITEDILLAGYIASMENPMIDKYMGEITFDEFKKKVSEFEVWGIVDDMPAGVIFFDGNCIHISILKEYYGKCGFIILRALRKALRKYGTLIGLVDKGDLKAQKFNKKLGFEKIGMTNSYLFYYHRG